MNAANTGLAHSGTSEGPTLVMKFPSRPWSRTRIRGAWPFGSSTSTLLSKSLSSWRHGIRVTRFSRLRSKRSRIAALEALPDLGLPVEWGERQYHISREICDFGAAVRPRLTQTVCGPSAP
jgi:hypothetical protein